MTARTALTILMLATALACSPGVQPPEPPSDVPETLVAERIAEAHAAVEEDPQSAEAWGRLGNVYDVHRYFERALTCYDRALELDPEGWHWPYHSGIVHREGDQAAALEAFAKAVAIEPDYAPLQLYLGFGHFLDESVDLAAEHYQRALELEPQSVNARIGLAQVAVASRRLDDAVTLLEEALAIAPEEAAVHHHLAHVYRMNGDEATAELQTKLAATSAVGMQPGEMASFPDPVRNAVTLREGVSSTWLLTNGQIHLAEGRTQQAREAFALALGATPDSVPAILASARMSLADGDAQLALTLVSRAVELAPSDATPHVDHGMVLARVNQLPQAIEAYRKALEIDPNLPDAKSNLATLLFQTGQTAEGTMLLQGAAAEFPGRPDIQQNLANVYLMTGQDAAATRLLGEAIENHPSHAGVHHLLGVVQTFQGENAAAVETFRKTVALDPTNLEVRGGLAIALWQLKRYAEAMTEFREAHQLAPADMATLKEYAWALAVCPQDDLRDGAEALRLARRVNEATQYNDPRFLDVFAAAQAETGDYAGAVASLNKALEIVDDTARRISGQLDLRQAQQMQFFADGLRGRRDLFQARRPYREP